MWLPSCPVSSCLSVCLIICVCLHLYLCVSLSFSGFLFSSLHMFLSSYMGVRGRGGSFGLKVSLFCCQCVCGFSVFLFIFHVCICPFIYPFIYNLPFSLYLPFCLCLSFSLCVSVSLHISVCLPVIPISLSPSVCVSFLWTLLVLLAYPYAQSSSPPEEL